MRIAFDVKGTIEGPHKAKVLKLFHALRAQGHELVVWSNLYSYAVAAVRDNNLDCAFQDKTAMYEMADEPDKIFDVAIEDDTRQTYLAARRFIWVHELPDDIETFAKQFSVPK